MLWALFYSAPLVTEIVSDIFIGPPANHPTWLVNLTMILFFSLGVVSIFHAFRVRKEYLMRLEALKREKRRKEEALRQQIIPETNQKEPARDQTPHTVETSGKADPSYAPGEETRFSSQPDQPLPSKRDTLIPYEKLLEVCTNYIGGGYYVDRAIPPKKLATAHEHFPIPDTERVVALIDSTVTGRGKAGLAICNGGIYWRNDWTTKTTRTFLSWDEFAWHCIISNPAEHFREAKPHPPASSGSSGNAWGLAIPTAAFFERIMEELEQREEGLYYQSAYIPY